MHLNFICRASKKRRNGLCPLELSITVGEERKVLTLERSVRFQDFNSKSQRVKRDDLTNAYMDSVKAKFYSIESEMIHRNMAITLQNVLEVYRNGFEETNVTLLYLFDRHNQDAEKKMKQGIIVRATYLKCLRTRFLLADFLKKHLRKRDILITDVTPAITERFFVYLNTKMAKNTAIHKIKLLKKVLKMAVEDGYIRAMPFKLKLTSDPLLYEPLTIAEIRQLRQKHLDIERIAQIRDIFVFACYTGLAFTDLKNLSKNDLMIDECGREWIIKPRQKTKIISHIPLLPVAKEIWEKYDYMLPLPENQKYNAYLKEIGDVCGIKKKLHSHLARHTFATILLNSGVDLVSVSKILGHSNSRITEKTYAKMMPETIMKRVVEVADQLM